MRLKGDGEMIGGEITWFTKESQRDRRSRTEDGSTTAGELRTWGIRLANSNIPIIPETQQQNNVHKAIHICKSMPLQGSL